MTDVRPYRIAVPDEVLTDLRDRLARTRWPEPECVDDWSQGIPLDYTRDLATYWAQEYDWRAREAAPQPIRPLPDRDRRPGHSFHSPALHETRCTAADHHPWLAGLDREFHKVIEPLAEDFHVVCPSLPGYGFSGKPSRTGWSVERIAQAWATLMARLGYDRYGAQGGDWGSAITAQMGRNGQGCIAIHVNMPFGFPSGGQEPTPAEAAALARMADHLRWGTGYSEEQSTRPQTLGYGLTDSPVGQLAWIVEKFWAWTDCDGHPENVLTRDEMLDNVMLYWVTASATSSARLYWESFKNLVGGGPVPVPTGVAAFPKEIAPSLRHWCESRYTITHWTDMPRGGHFAAFEQPELFVEDVRTFFGTVR